MSNEIKSINGQPLTRTVLGAPKLKAGDRVRCPTHGNRKGTIESVYQSNDVDVGDSHRYVVGLDQTPDQERNDMYTRMEFAADELRRI